jgi:hypothetical protein
LCSFAAKSVGAGCGGAGFGLLSGRSGVSSERRILNLVCGGLPTRRYGQKFEDVVKSAQDAAVLVLVY